MSFFAWVIAAFIFAGLMALGYRMNDIRNQDEIVMMQLYEAGLAAHLERELTREE